jgi:hypothetical protein
MFGIQDALSSSQPFPMALRPPELIGEVDWPVQVKEVHGFDDLDTFNSLG